MHIHTLKYIYSLPSKPACFIKLLGKELNLVVAIRASCRTFPELINDNFSTYVPLVRLSCYVYSRLCSVQIVFGEKNIGLKKRHDPPVLIYLRSRMLTVPSTL